MCSSDLRLLTIPYYVLFPAIMAFAAIGVYSVNSNAFDLFAVTFFGGLGYLLVRLGCEPAPLLLGFVIGPMMEEHLRRALLLSRGNATVFLTRPISATILLVALIALFLHRAQNEAELGLGLSRRRNESERSEDERSDEGARE